MKKTDYFGRVKYCMLIVHVRLPFFLRCLFLLFLFCALPEIKVKAQDNFISNKEDVPLVFDDFPVKVKVDGFGSFYLNIIYTNNDVLYINIEELFKALNIPCIVGQKGNTLNGFIEKESRTYTIDYINKQIKVGNNTMNSQNGLIKEMSTLFMESSLFAEVFGITLNFNYQDLTLFLKSNFELPIIKQRRLEKQRSNLSKLTGEEIVDTVVQRNYHVFKFGTLNWSVASSHLWKKTTEASSPKWYGSSDNHLGLSVGTELLYGEADISIDYYSKYKFDNRQLNYLWRWVDNNKSIIKQAQIGRIYTQTISFINSPVIGGIIRNSPTTVRKAKGYYTINEYTEPNWTVELYINNVMVDYIKADASGAFIFKVPIVYGYTTLKLKFYGPTGEEHTEERTMNVPYTVMPAKEFEYGLSGGMVQDSSSSRFGRGEFNYGVNRFLTMGGGLEYLSSIPNGALIPFAKVTIQPFSKLTLSGEYAQGVRSRGLLNYYFGKDILLEIDYSKYVEGQLATRFNALEERKVKLSLPLKYKMIKVFAKLDYSQLVYNAFNYNQANIMFSTYYKNISANSTTQLNWINQKTPYFISDVAVSYRLNKGYYIRPSVQYNISNAKFIKCKAVIEKRISKGYLSFSYERNVLYNENLMYISFKYDLPFARTNVSASGNRDNLNASESIQGGLALGSGNKYIHESNNPSLSKGGISLYPFLDLNHNGVFDVDEHMVKLSSVRVSGGKVIFSERDSIVRIPDLNAFTDYILEFNDSDLENIAWRFTKKRYRVLIDPNQFKRIDIPIIPVGEVSGMVYMKTDNFLKGMGRILVKYYKKNSNKVVAETLSESDGYIYYLGLEPGEYIARVDSAQLSNLDFTVDHQQINFTIKTLKEGDIVKGIDFVLNDKKIKKIPETETLPIINIKKDVKLVEKASYNNEDMIIYSGLQIHTVKYSIVSPKDSNVSLNVKLSDGQNNIVSPKDSNVSLNVELADEHYKDYTYILGEICNPIVNYSIRCGAFKYKDNAMKLALLITQKTDEDVNIIYVNGLYKINIGCITTWPKANEIRSSLIKKGVYANIFIMKRK